MSRLRCAILDDYFNLALDVADWQKLSDRLDVTVFSHPFASERAAATARGALDGLRAQGQPPGITESPC